VRPNGHKLDAQLLDLSLGGARVTLPQHWSPENGARCACISRTKTITSRSPCAGT
jgi:hypothetical protein